MPYYEVIFENGRSSIASYKDDDDALAAVGAHHARAKRGEVGGPTGHPAERIVKLLKYDRHPAEYNLANALTADELNKLVPDLIKELADANGVVSVGALSAEVRALSHPMVVGSGPHESNFKMKESGVIEADAIEKASEA